MADFEEQLNLLLQEAADIYSPLGIGFLENDNAASKWMNDVQIFNDKYLKEHPLEQRMKTFDFRPQFKLYINTNYLPSVDDMSLFSSNRVRVIPFDRHFEPQEQDPNLKHLFAKEESKSAILNWLIAGWQLLQKEGLNSPAAVVEATKEYSRDSNKIALFAEEKLIEDRTGEARTAAVYERYKEWCDVNGCMPENSTNFKKSLQAIGTVVRRRPRDGSEKTTLLLGYRLR